VELAASLAWYFTEENAEVSFLVAGLGWSRDVHEFLAWLAVVQPRSKGQGRDDRELRETRSGVGAYTIILTAESSQVLPERLRDWSSFVFLTA
jgi:hypothetical protein